MESTTVFPSRGQISRLSDEVLLMILRFLPTPDLVSVSRSCVRLKRLSQDQELWKYVVNPSDDYGSMTIALANCNQKTKVLKISSTSHGENRAFRSSFGPSMFSNTVLRLQRQLDSVGMNLSQIHLIRQKLDGRLFNLKMLPQAIKTLNLCGTFITNISEESHYFKDLGAHLQQLEDLDMTDCTWVTAHSLLALSKCPTLKRLCLKGCRNIGNCLAYIAISSRFGFKSLKILDVTNTNVGSSEFTSFGSIPTLEEFYLGQYDESKDEDFNLVDDICFLAIRNSQRLQVLDISGSYVSDAVLETFTTLPMLRRVDAHFTQLSAEGIECFHQRIPRCKINRVDYLPGQSRVQTSPSTRHFIQGPGEVINFHVHGAHDIHAMY